MDISTGYSARFLIGSEWFEEKQFDTIDDVHKYAVKEFFNGYKLFTVEFAMINGKKFQAKPEPVKGMRYIGDFKIMSWEERDQEYKDQIDMAKEDNLASQFATFSAWREEHQKDDRSTIYFRKIKERINMVRKLTSHDIVFDKAGNQVWPKSAPKFQKTSAPKL